MRVEGRATGLAGSKCLPPPPPPPQVSARIIRKLETRKGGTNFVNNCATLIAGITYLELIKKEAISMVTFERRYATSAGSQERRRRPATTAGLGRVLTRSTASWSKQLLPLLLLLLVPLLPPPPPPPPPTRRLHRHHRHRRARPHTRWVGMGVGVVELGRRDKRCCGCGASRPKICRWRRWSGEQADF